MNVVIVSSWNNARVQIITVELWLDQEIINNSDLLAGTYVHQSASFVQLISLSSKSSHALLL